MCKKTPFRTFVSRMNQSGYNFRPDCGRWSCFECRPKLEEDWNHHASTMFATCPAGIGYLCVPEDRLEAALKRLSRAGAQYIRIRGHGIFHIYTSRNDLGQKSLSEHAALEMFAEHLSLAPSGQRHVISTSRSWKHASRAQKATGEQSDSICIAIGAGPETIRTILERLNQTHSVAAGALTFRFQAPAILESFVRAVHDVCPNLPYKHKKVSGNSDNPPLVSTGPAKFQPNPAFEALRSP